MDSNASTTDSDNTGESMVPFTQFESGAWTEEQYFTHVTQDSDRGA